MFLYFSYLSTFENTKSTTGFQEGKCPLCYEKGDGNNCVTTPEHVRDDPDYKEMDVNGHDVSICTRCYDNARPLGEMSYNFANYMKSRLV